MKYNFTKLLATIFLAAVLFLSFIKQSQGQNIYTIAGDSTAGFNFDNIPAITAELSTPGDVAVDDSGNIYISDENNQRIRKVTLATGIITTIAGTGTASYTGDGSAATAAEINTPYGIALDDSDNVYFADGSNNVVRKITVSTGIITTVAGNYALGAGFNMDNIAATAAQLYQPSGIAIDDSGNLFIADFRNQRIREVRKATGIITTVAGNGTAGFVDNVAANTSGEMYYPGGVGVDDSDNVYIADAGNDRIRKVSAKTGIISTIAGNGVNAPNNGAYCCDGQPAIDASLFWCVRLAVDDSANVIICDEYNERIRKITAATGIITTIAGTGYGQGTLNGGYNGDSIPATSAELNAPGGVAVDNCGNVYIADDYNERVREVVSPGSSHNISISPDSLSICSGTSDTLKASGAGVYTWSPATGLSATTGAVVITNPTISTTYTITGGSGICAAIKTVVVKVNSVLPLIVQPQDTSLCAGMSITLSVPVSGLDYTWSPSSTLSSPTGNTVVATPVVTTTYTITGSDSLGCSALGFDTVSVKKAVNKPTITDTDNVLTSTATQSNQWYRSSSAINGATNKTYTATDTGCYWSIATNLVSGCSSISDTICLTSLSGINRLLINPNLLSIYPNPTGGEIFINISSSVGNVKDWNLQITDVLGRAVYTRQSLNYSNDIDLSNLPSGVYFITVINNVARAVFPVVKQN
jgi:trimeric autotransporter adhesin